jgi:hypothetical protein
VQLQMPDDGRYDSLCKALREFEPQLVFLSGHGRFHHQPHSDTAPYGEFLFADDQGRGDPRCDADLVRAFTGRAVGALVLSACESGKAASDSLNLGLTRQLAALGLPHVIGMRESILDHAGIQFARAFCDAIAQRERVDQALQQARAAITRTAPADATHRDADDGRRERSHGHWCLPMLLSRDPGQALIDWDFKPRPPPPRPARIGFAGITLPTRFIGRRRELRRLLGADERGFPGGRPRLLITGPGGQGKTGLAGRRAPGPGPPRIGRLPALRPRPAPVGRLLPGP